MDNAILITKDSLDVFGKILKDLRKEANVSQLELAQNMNKIQPFISCLESEINPKLPSLPTLVHYLDSIGCQLYIGKK